LIGQDTSDKEGLRIREEFLNLKEFTPLNIDVNVFPDEFTIKRDDCPQKEEKLERKSVDPREEWSDCEQTLDYGETQQYNEDCLDL